VTEGEGTAARGKYLTRADVARRLAVSPNTVSRWAREGRLPCQMTLGGHRRFDGAVVEAIRRRLRLEGGEEEAG
jgi:excisionase family DNA binding protein